MTETTNHPFIGRQWNSHLGIATIISMPYAAKPEYGMQAVFEINYANGSYLRVDENKVEAKILRDEYDATPEGRAKKAAEHEQFQRDQQAIASAEAFHKAKKHERLETINLWLSTTKFTPMQAGKAREALLKEFLYCEFNQSLSRSEFIEKRIFLGDKPETREENKIKEMSRMAYFRASGQEQDDHEKKIREAGTKTVYSIGNYDVTKAEFDFANYLISIQIMALTPA